MSYSLEDVKKRAKEELEEEEFEKQVELLKEKLRRKKWWHRFFPWIISVRRRT